jgi:hypothetical protein
VKRSEQAVEGLGRIRAGPEGAAIILGHDCENAVAKVEGARLGAVLLPQQAVAAAPSGRLWLD